MAKRVTAEATADIEEAVEATLREFPAGKKVEEPLRI